MSLTKNNLKNRIEQIKKLEDEARQLKATLTDCLKYQQGWEPEQTKYFADMMDGTQDADALLNAFEDKGILEGMEQGGEELPYPYITVDKFYPFLVDLNCQINKVGDRFVAYISESDKNTVQAGILYKTAKNNTFDIAMAERKWGELAEVHGYSPDNEDIDLYTYQDVTDESYIDAFRIKKEDIDEVERELEEDGYILTE